VRHRAHIVADLSRLGRATRTIPAQQRLLLHLELVDLLGHPGDVRVSGLCELIRDGGGVGIPGDGGDGRDRPLDLLGQSLIGQGLGLTSAAVSRVWDVAGSSSVPPWPCGSPPPRG
jgi:hypothetical protein